MMLLSLIGALLLVPCLGAPRLLRSRSLPIPPDAIVKATTRLWTALFVRDLGLCPWSAAVLQNEQRLRVRVSASSGEALLHEVVKETELLMAGELPQTTLIVCPRLTGFPQYLRALQAAEDRLASLGLDVEVQLASFHPDYCFQDEPRDSVTNWTNRSPFPMLHLLRVADVSQAISQMEAHGGSTEQVWQRNMATMRQLGEARIRMIHAEVKERARTETQHPE